MSNWTDKLAPGDSVTVKYPNGVLSDTVETVTLTSVTLKKGDVFSKKDCTSEKDEYVRMYPAEEFSAVAKAHSLVLNMEAADVELHLKRPCTDDNDCRTRLAALIATFPSKRAFANATGIPNTTVKNWMTDMTNNSYRCPPHWIIPILEEVVDASRMRQVKAVLKKLAHG